MTIVFLVVGIVAMLELAPAAAANIRYAAPHGTGAQPCLQSDPCNSVKAITGTGTNGVQDLDQVVLEPGTYTPGQTIEVNNAIDVGGQAGAARPVLDEGGNPNPWGILVNNASATIHDLGIVNASAPVIGGLAMNGGVAERLNVSTSSYACVASGATVLRNSVCSSGTGLGLFVTQGAPVARNVTASGGGGAGYGIEVGAGGGAHVSLDALNVIVLNGVHADTDSSSGVSATVTLSHSNYAAAAHAGSGATVTPAGTNGNQTAAPLLSADLHELAGSPTIDAGLAAPDIGSFDLDRNPRIAPACLGGTAAGNPDIGAYEFPTASPPAAACSVFEIGALSRNKKKGRGALTVTVPGSGLLAATGKGLKTTSASPPASGDVILNLKASGKAKRKLARSGKAKLKITLSWTPTGGSATTQTDKVKLLKR